MTTPDDALDRATQRAVLGTVAMVNGIIETLPGLDHLPDLIATMERALALGPYVAPSEWLAGADNTRAILDVLRPLEQYRRLLKETRVRLEVVE